MLSLHDVGGEERTPPRSRSKDCIHNNYAIVFARDLYFASVLDLETVGCFLELHEIKLEPKKTQ
jgi:hypothetical protein